MPLSTIWHSFGFARAWKKSARVAAEYARKWLSAAAWARTQYGTCSPTWSGLGFDKHLTLILLDLVIKPLEEDRTLATVKPTSPDRCRTRILSSLTGRTSGLLIESGRLHVFCYQFGGSSNSAEPLPQKARVSGVAARWRNSVKWSCAWAHGIPRHAPRDRPAWMKSISIATLSSARIRKRGSEATAAVSGAPEPGESWQSIAGYVAWGVRGDPRGRKPGAGPEATNPR